MDRARPRRSHQHGLRRDVLRLWLVAAALTLACTELTDFDRIVAIEIVGSTNLTIQVGDTVQLRARAVTAAGDTVPDAVITWALLDVDSGQVGFALDTETGQVAAMAPGMGRVQALTETLRSGTIVITVIDPPPAWVRHDTPRAEGGASALSHGRFASRRRRPAHREERS